jgi:hypothetical protein
MRKYSRAYRLTFLFQYLCVINCNGMAAVDLWASAKAKQNCFNFMTHNIPSNRYTLVASASTNKIRS